jgi:hypothetical protein
MRVQKSLTFSDGKPCGELKQYHVFMSIEPLPGIRQFLMAEAETDDPLWMLEKVVGAYHNPAHVRTAVMRDIEAPNNIAAAYFSSRAVLESIVPHDRLSYVCEGYAVNGRRIFPCPGIVQRIQ